MWYKINVYNKPHTGGLTEYVLYVTTHWRTDNGNTYYMWYKINVYNKPHTDGLTTVIRIICDIRLMFIINHTDGLTTVIRIICDIRLMFIINHILTDWQR